MNYDNNPKFIKRSYAGRDITYERKTAYGDEGFVIRGIRGVTRGDSSMNAFYDSEGNFIKATRTEGGKTFQVPKGAKVGFFRMLGRKYRTNPANRFDETLERYHGGDDPSRQEMMEHIKGVYGREADRFDIEEAIYWFSNDYHGGQGSNLYSALSMSPYRPGAISSGPEEGSMAEMIYADLVDTFSTKKNPLKRRKGESVRDFTSRCMSEEKESFPKTKQRIAVCLSKSRKRNPLESGASISDDEDINAQASNMG